MGTFPPAQSIDSGHAYHRKTGFRALESLLTRTESVAKSNEEEDDDAALTAIDYEEANAGYQAAFSKLVASQPKVADPVSYVPDVPTFAKQALSKGAAQNPRIRVLVSGLPPSPLKSALQAS